MFSLEISVVVSITVYECMLFTKDQRLWTTVLCRGQSKSADSAFLCPNM